MTDKYLQKESECTDIANAIRAKNGEPSTKKYKHRDFATAIGKLPTLTPNLTISADRLITTGDVTLEALLEVNESGVSDNILNGKLEKSPIKFYKQGSTTPLYESITNKDGVAYSSTQTITEDTYYIAKYEGVSGKYKAVTSSPLKIEWCQPLPQNPPLDGSEKIKITTTEFGGTGYITNNEFYALNAYLKPCFCTNNDFELNLKFKVQNGSAFALTSCYDGFIDPSSNLKQHLRFGVESGGWIQYKIGTTTTTTYGISVPENAYNDLKVIQQDNKVEIYLNNTLIRTVNDTFNTPLHVGGYRWSNSKLMSIKDISIIEV